MFISWRRAGLVHANGNILRIKNRTVPQSSLVRQLLTSEQCIAVETRWDVILYDYQGTVLHCYQKTDVVCMVALEGECLRIQDDDVEHVISPDGHVCRMGEPAEPLPAPEPPPRISPNGEWRAACNPMTGELAIVDRYPLLRRLGGDDLVMLVKPYIAHTMPL